MSIRIGILIPSRIIRSKMKGLGQGQEIDRNIYKRTIDNEPRRLMTRPGLG